MIARAVDFAQNNRLFILAFTVLVVGAGIIAFPNCRSKRIRTC
jgi:hypothetical protein